MRSAIGVSFMFEILRGLIFWCINMKLDSECSLFQMKVLNIYFS